MLSAHLGLQFIADGGVGMGLAIPACGLSAMALRMLEGADTLVAVATWRCEEGDAASPLRLAGDAQYLSLLPPLVTPACCL